MEKQYPNSALIALYDPDAIGIRTLASAANERYGINVNQIYFKNLFPEEYPFSNQESDLLIGLLKDMDVDLVGVSLRSSSFQAAEKLIGRIRKEFPGVKLIIGGTHAIIAPEECIRLADMVCIGEGEEPFIHLLENFNRPEALRDIQGLWVKEDGQIVKNSINELVDVNSLPRIDYSNGYKWYIENNEVTPGDPLNEGAVGEIFASRGCPFHCTYCTNNILKGIMHKGRFVRMKSVDNTIDDIDNVKKYFPNLKKIVFADEIFAYNKKWSKEFCEKYRSQIGLPFAALFNPNMVKEDIVQMLTEVGLVHARMGIQAGSERVRKEIYKRNESNKKIIEAAKIFQKTSIRLTFDLIVNNPFETEKDLKEALEFLLEIPKPFELNLHSLVYFPKTELTQKAIDEGIIKKEHVEGYTDEALRLNHVLLKDKAMIYNYSNNLFWNSLFSLTSKSFLPAWFVKLLAGSDFLRKQPNYLLGLAKLSNMINVVFIGIHMVRKREIGFSEVLDAARKFKQTLAVNK